MNRHLRTRPMSKVPAILLIIILLLLAGMGYMSGRVNRILQDNPALAQCLQSGRTAQQCRAASDAGTLDGSAAASAATTD